MAVRWLTRTEAKAALGELPERTFARWVAKGMPRKGEGKRERYPWPEIQRWLIDRARAEGRESVRPADYEDARARKAMAEAEMAEYDLALRRRELMTTAEGETVLAEAFQRVRGQLLAVANRLAPDLVGIQTLPEAHARVTEAMADVMQELAKAEDVPVAADADEGDDAADAA